MKDKINNILESKISLEALVYLNNHKDTNINVMAMNLHRTYNWFFILVKNLERLGFVSIKKEGRDNAVKLTKKGQEIADCLIKINKIQK